MKLKYYLRGLGIGILLTTLIFTLSNREEKLSEEEIIERAEDLGMIMKDEDSNNLKEVLDNLEVTLTPTPSIAPTPTIEPTTAPTPEPTQAPTPEPTKEPESTKAPSEQTEISFSIESGMTSGKVASLLESKGLIEDADDFNRYIIKKGKASIIRVGSYKISADASYDEIITLITTRQ